MRFQGPDPYTHAHSTVSWWDILLDGHKKPMVCDGPSYLMTYDHVIQVVLLDTQWVHVSCIKNIMYQTQQAGWLGPVAFGEASWAGSKSLKQFAYVAIRAFYYGTNGFREALMAVAERYLSSLFCMLMHHRSL